MIKTVELTKRYGELIAVDRFNCDISEGNIVGLLGANGAGKSTLMKMVTGYLSPSSGKVFVGEYDIFSDPTAARSSIGYLPETTPLYGDMRVEDYLEYMAGLKRVPFSSQKERVNRVIAQCSLGKVRRQKIATISKGYRQRTGLAQALVADPPVLIVDEPTSALDPAQIKETRQLFKELGEKKTILISTHILSEVEQLCNQVIVMHRGKSLLQESLERLVRKRLHLQIGVPKHLFREKAAELERAYPVTYDETQTEKCAFWIEDGENDPRKEIWKICHRQDWPILCMEYALRSLEELYLQATRAEKVV